MKRFRVLVIDSRPDMLDLVKNLLLLQHGIQLGILEVICVSDSRQGLKRIQEVQPDVIILDYYMPVMSGGLLLHTLRAMGDETPIIMLTTASMSEIGEELLSMCDVYLSKPFRISTLYDYVHVFLWQNLYRHTPSRKMLAQEIA
jgi:CheY-like chemotaxis protein